MRKRNNSNKDVSNWHFLCLSKCLLYRGFSYDPYIFPLCPVDLSGSPLLRMLSNAWNKMCRETMIQKYSAATDHLGRRTLTEPWPQIERTGLSTWQNWAAWTSFRARTSFLKEARVRSSHCEEGAPQFRNNNEDDSSHNASPHPFPRASLYAFPPQAPFPNRMETRNWQHWYKF